MRHFFVVMELLEGQRWTVRGLKQVNTPAIIASFCTQYVLMSSVSTVIIWLHPHKPSRLARSWSLRAPHELRQGCFLETWLFEQIGEEKTTTWKNNSMRGNFGCQVKLVPFSWNREVKFWRTWLHIVVQSRPWQQHLKGTWAEWFDETHWINGQSVVSMYSHSYCGLCL